MNIDKSEEDYLREMLALLYEDYLKAAKPYIDRLVAIQELKPGVRMFMTLEHAEAMGLKVSTLTNPALPEQDL